MIGAELFRRFEDIQERGATGLRQSAGPLAFESCLFAPAERL